MSLVVGGLAVGLTDLVRRPSPDGYFTFFGDSNLDGEFNSGDLVAVFQAGEYENGVAANSTWATGDWNGDTEFDTRDLVFAFRDAGFEAGTRQQELAVPEPNSLLLSVLASLMLPDSTRRIGHGFAAIRSTD